MEEKLHLDDLSLDEQDHEAATGRLRACQDTIATMGWRWFIAEVEKEIGVIKEQLLTARGDEFVFLQGKADQCAQIVVFEDLVDNYLAQLHQNEPEEEEEE